MVGHQLAASGAQGAGGLAVRGQGEDGSGKRRRVVGHAGVPPSTTAIPSAPTVVVTSGNAAARAWKDL